MTKQEIKKLAEKIATQAWFVRSLTFECTVEAMDIVRKSPSRHII